MKDFESLSRINPRDYIYNCSDTCEEESIDFFCDSKKDFLFKDGLEDL